MANEANIQSGQQLAAPLQSLADLGTIQINMVLKSIETLTPVAGSLAKTMTDILAASVNLLASVTGTAAGFMVSAGGVLLNAMGTIAFAPVRIIGNLTGARTSVAPSGTGTTASTLGSVPPAQKPV